MALLDPSGGRGQARNAKLALACVRKSFGWCTEQDALTELPAYRIRLNGTVKPRERNLSLDELRRLWAAAEKNRRYGRRTGQDADTHRPAPV